MTVAYGYVEDIIGGLRMTISEIAELAGVSIGTVDRVLHNRGRVAPETVKKIMDIVQENDYRPNTFARNLKLNKGLHIGIVLPQLHSEFGYWNLIYEGMLSAAKELAALSVSIEVHEFDRNEEGSCIKAAGKLLRKKIDALVMAPVRTSEAQEVVSGLECPYAFIDSPLPDTHPVTTVAQNPGQAGYLAGRMMNLLSPEPGDYVVCQTHQDAFNSTERAAGFSQFFAGKDGFSVHDMAFYEDKPVDWQVENLYREFRNIRGIFVVNDSVHRIADTVTLMGRKPQTTLIGYDLIDQNCRAMRDGKVDCLISQRPEFQGYTAIYQLYRKGILNQEPEQSTEVPIDIFLLENLPLCTAALSYHRQI